MKSNSTYIFSAPVAVFGMPANWYFVMLPEKILTEKLFRKKMKEKATRFARVMVNVTTEDKESISWETALLPHSSFMYSEKETEKKIKMSRLFIPIKKAIRKKLGLDVGEMLHVSFHFSDTL